MDDLLLADRAVEIVRSETEGKLRDGLRQHDPERLKMRHIVEDKA